MTQETFEKAVSIQDDLTRYRKINKIAEKPLIYMADGNNTVYHVALPDDLLSCMKDFCSDRIKELEKEFSEL